HWKPPLESSFPSNTRYRMPSARRRGTALLDGARSSQCPLEDLVTPEPFVAENLFATQFGEALEDRLEIVHDVLGPIAVCLGGETAVNVAAGLEPSMERVDRRDRIDEMLEHVHRADEIKGGSIRVPGFQIDGAGVARAR